MSSSKELIDDILDIFDIKSGDDASNDYTNTAGDQSTKRDFSELAEEIGDSLDGDGLPELEVREEDTEPMNEVDKNEIKDNVEIEQKEVPTNNIEENIKNVISLSNDDNDTSVDIDNIFNKNNSTKEETVDESRIQETSNANARTAEATKEVVEDAPESDNLHSKEQNDQTVVSQKTEQVTQNETDKSIEVKAGVKMKNGAIVWLLEPPSDKYKPFYEAKADALSNILPDGQVPFEKYKKELREAHVPVNIQDINVEDLYEKMIEIQRWRERVTYISSHINQQYYLWDRFVEMLHGVLARTEYEKPALKQEGIIFQHMRDMELYNQHLKSMHSIANSVAKNLDASWDMISRSVTIMMNEISRSDPSRYEANKSNKQETPSREPNSDPTLDKNQLDEFDGLDGTASTNLSSKPKGSQMTDWENI